MKPITDLIKLIQQAQAHDKEALETLLLHVRNRMKGYFHERAGPIESSDFAQDILVKVACNLDDFEGQEDAQFWAWVTTLARTRWIDYIRWQKRDKRVTQVVPLPEGSSGAVRLPDMGESPSEVAQRLEQENAIVAALAKLGPIEQAVIQLRYFQQRPWEEVAAALTKNVEATRKFYQRALKKWHSACTEA